MPRKRAMKAERRGVTNNEKRLAKIRRGVEDAKDRGIGNPGYFNEVPFLLSLLDAEKEAREEAESETARLRKELEEARKAQAAPTDTEKKGG